MLLVVVVNVPDGLAPDQTTTLLAWGAARRGWDVRLVGCAGLVLDPDGRVLALARRVVAGADPAATLRALAGAPVDILDLAEADAVFARTNPARHDVAPAIHAAATELLSLVAGRGVVVANDPRTLRRVGGKLSLVLVPAHRRPRTCIASDPDVLRRFVASTPGLSVLKPLHGSRGRDVGFVDGPDDPALPHLLAKLLREGPAVAQAWVAGAEDGDTRLLLLDGAPLAVEGRIAAVRRVPAPGERRSNVACGGTVARADTLDEVLAVAADVGPRLRSEGVLLAGLDVIGDRVVEVNLHAPGGLLDAGRFEGVDFVPPVLDALDARVRRAATAPRPGT